MNRRERRAAAKDQTARAGMSAKTRSFSQKMILAWLKACMPSASDAALEILAWGGVELLEKRLAVIVSDGDPFDLKNTRFTLKLTELGEAVVGPDMVAAFGGMQ